RAPFQAALRDLNRMCDVATFLCHRSRIEFESLFTACVESLTVRLAKYLAYLPRRSLFPSEGPPGGPGWIDPSPTHLTPHHPSADRPDPGRAPRHARTPAPDVERRAEAVPAVRHRRARGRQDPRREFPQAALRYGGEREASRRMARGNPFLGRTAALE